MQKRMTPVVVGFIALWIISPAAQTQSADPWVGTWKVDLAKSTFSPGPKPTAAGTIKVERSGAGMKTTIDGTDAQGKHGNRVDV